LTARLAASETKVDLPFRLFREHPMHLQDLLPQLLTGSALEYASRHPLHDVSGVRLRGEGHAMWHVAGLSADLISDALDDIQVRLPFPAPTSARTALEESAQLSANWRWADTRNGRMLLADVSGKHQPALPAVFRDLETGVHQLRELRGARACGGDEVSVDKQQLLALLQPPWWDSQSVVELPNGWELRPTIGAHVIPVSLVIDGDRVRCRRLVVSSGDTDAVTEAIWLQALRSNSRLKHSRLVLVDGRLMAEACLHRELISGQAIVAAARAVAVAEHRVRMSLGILREHEEIAAPFAAMFAVHDVPPG